MGASRGPVLGRDTAEERWGSLTKCGVMETTTVRRDCDSPSCRFVMKFREVIPVPIFQEFKVFLNGDPRHFNHRLQHINV